MIIPGPPGCFQRRTCEPLFTMTIFSSNRTIHPSFFCSCHPLFRDYFECVSDLCLSYTVGLVNTVSWDRLTDSCVLYPLIVFPVDRLLKCIYYLIFNKIFLVINRFIFGFKKFKVYTKKKTESVFTIINIC